MKNDIIKKKIMEKSIKAFLQKLEQESTSLRVNLSKLNSIVSSLNSAYLNEMEQKINAIHFFRSIGYADTNAVCYYAHSQELISEVDTELTRSIKYLIYASIEFESYIEEELNNKELVEYLIKCDQEYILWFSEIWHSCGCHLNNRINYILIENNSTRSFDLNSMKWVNNAFENLDLKENFYLLNPLFKKDVAMKKIKLNYEY